MLQVHLARMKGGEEVAVKVQRAGLKDLFDKDLKVRQMTTDAVAPVSRPPLCRTEMEHLRAWCVCGFGTDPYTNMLFLGVFLLRCAVQEDNACSKETVGVRPARSVEDEAVTPLGELNRTRYSLLGPWVDCL